VSPSWGTDAVMKLADAENVALFPCSGSFEWMRGRPKRGIREVQRRPLRAPLNLARSSWRWRPRPVWYEARMVDPNARPTSATESEPGRFVCPTHDYQAMVSATDEGAVLTFNDYYQQCPACEDAWRKANLAAGGQDPIEGPPQT
jgi:hypothetical protein